jgi:hypothetical protein
MLTAILEGGIYKYMRGHPADCIGCLYRVHRHVRDVPSYQRKVLVEALNGPDQGLWFVCSLTNFAVRYELASEEQEEA